MLRCQKRVDENRGWPVGMVRHWMILAVAATLLASCATTPTKTAARASLPEPKIIEPPYLWTQGAAPQAYKDMVAEFGRKGLRPGEYIWASAIPVDGDTRIVIDRLTQMAY